MHLTLGVQNYRPRQRRNIRQAAFLQILQIQVEVDWHSGSSTCCQEPEPNLHSVVSAVLILILFWHVSVSRLSRDIWLPCLGLGSVSTLVYLVLARVSSFHVSSCLVSYDCVLTVSLSGTAKCLLCAETQACLAESRPLGSITGRLLTIKRLFLWLLLFSGYNVSW